MQLIGRLRGKINDKILKKRQHRLERPLFGFARLRNLGMF
jgi:hypothetical protein